MTKFGDDWLSRSWDFVKFPYKQTDKLTNRQTWPTNILAKMVILARNDQPTNTTNKHTCQNQILASNEKAIWDCVLAKICWYNAHCNGNSDSWDIVDYIDVWQVWLSIGLHVLAYDANALYPFLPIRPVLWPSDLVIEPLSLKINRVLCWAKMHLCMKFCEAMSQQSGEKWDNFI